MKIALVLCALLAVARTAEIRTRRDVGAAVAFPGDEPPVAEEAGLATSAALGDTIGAARVARSPEADYEDYGDEEDGAEGRSLGYHKLKRKLKRKFKPGHGFGGLLGGYPGYGHGGHGHGHGGHGHIHGGHGCRKLHGCGGGGWQQPFGGHGPVAIASAGAGPGYGGWNPGYGGGYGHGHGHNQAQTATWNLGPFQASFGFAQAHG